uniref:Uncharacterized protein n=1 Tax=Arundo donax TaxID=35708 RepID=A0A0A9A2P5_ARUDO
MTKGPIISTTDSSYRIITICNTKPVCPCLHRLCHAHASHRSPSREESHRIPVSHASSSMFALEQARVNHTEQTAHVQEPGPVWNMGI